MKGTCEVPVKRSVTDRLTDLQKEYAGGKGLPVRSESIQTIDPGEFAERLCEPVFEWLASLTHSENTRQAYEQALRRFLGWLEGEAGPMPISGVVPGFKKHLENTSAPRTVALYVAGVRGFFEWASRTHGVPNIASDVKCKKPYGHTRDALSRTQALTLLRSVPTDTLEGVRDYAIIRLLLATGLRRSEVLGADVGDIVTKQGQPVLLVKCKGHVDKDSFKLLTPDTVRAIDAWLQARGSVKGFTGEDPLFVSLSNKNRFGRLSTMGLTRVVKARLKAAGIDTKRFTLHSLRHTAGTLLYEDTRDVLQAKTLLGHKNIQTTMIYVELLERLGENAPEHVLDRILQVESPLTDQEWRLGAMASQSAL